MKHGRSDVMLALGVIGILVMMIIPVPPVFLDLMLALNIMLGLVILLVALYTLEPLQFSIFPGMLLILTLFRLSINVASTRLILGEGYAGKVILAFGDFVVGGNIVVGFIVFLILVLINFIVITKGSGRVAEVAARFTLDAMPGKQMAIDADLNNGVITEKEARERREKISREADFYGAMDGASKFVRGDAIAGLVITVINLLGGMAVGVLQLGLTMAESARTFSLLTIGDGLVNQIPSLIISVAAGIIVTRAGSRSHFGTDLQNQLLGQVRPLAIAAVVLFFFALMPGLPTLPFLILAIGTGLLALSRKRAIATEEAETVAAAQPEGPAKERIEDYLTLDTMEIELGYGLISLVDREAGGDLLGRITSLRRQVALELGIVVPPIRIRDDLGLKPDEYRIRIRGNVVGSSELRTGCILALTGPGEHAGLTGIPTHDPTFGLPALWIRASERRMAETRGVAVVEPSAVLATHLETVVRRNAWRLLSLQDTKKLLDNLKGENQALVEELTPGILGLPAIHKVLQRLLKEAVPVRDLCTVLETLADTGSQTKDTDILVEYARFALSGSITAQLKGEDGRIRVVTLKPELEAKLQQEQEGNRGGGFSPDDFAAVVAELAQWRDKLAADGRVPVIVTRPEIRGYLRRLLEGPLPEMQVVSYSELQLDVELESLAAVGLPEPVARKPRMAEKAFEPQLHPA